MTRYPCDGRHGLRGIRFLNLAMARKKGETCRVDWKKKSLDTHRLSGNQSTEREEEVEVWITVLDDLSKFLR